MPVFHMSCKTGVSGERFWTPFTSESLWNEMSFIVNSQRLPGVQSSELLATKRTPIHRLGTCNTSLVRTA